MPNPWTVNGLGRVWRGRAILVVQFPEASAEVVQALHEQTTHGRMPMQCSLRPASRRDSLLHAKRMRNAPMPIIQIRDVPDDVYQGVAAAARAEQRSLSQQAVVELRRALGLRGADQVAAAVAELRASGRRLPPQAARPEDLLRDDRDDR